MLRRLAGLALVLATLTAAAAQVQEQPGWAHKIFSADGKAMLEHDFGSVPKGAILPHRWALTNIYAVPLTIQTRVSCDCVTVSLSHQTLQPRQTGYVDVQMDSRRFVGAKVVSIFFTVVHPQYTSTAILTVKGFCRTDVALNPGAINFGIVTPGQPVQTAVTVDYAGTLPWQITGFAKSDLFDVAVAERYRQPGRVGYHVQLSLKPDAPAGAYKQELALQTNDPSGPTLPVPFEIVIQPTLAVFPGQVRFANAKVGSPAEHKVSLKNMSRPFKIIEVEGVGDGLAVVEPIPSADARPVHILTLRLTPTAPGPLNRKLTFKTDDGRTASITIDGAANP
jgi:hypothetical protein